MEFVYSIHFPDPEKILCLAEIGVYPVQHTQGSHIFNLLEPRPAILFTKTKIGKLHIKPRFRPLPGLIVSAQYKAKGASIIRVLLVARVGLIVGIPPAKCGPVPQVLGFFLTIVVYIKRAGTTRNPIPFASAQAEELLYCLDGRGAEQCPGDKGATAFSVLALMPLGKGLAAKPASGRIAFVLPDPFHEAEGLQKTEIDYQAAHY
jgi:hypothetical protein